MPSFLTYVLSLTSTIKLRSDMKVKETVSAIVSLATVENHFLDLLCASEEPSHINV